MTNVLTAFSCQRTFVIFYLLNSDITGGVVHNYAFSCIHRHIGCRQRKCAWNLNGAHAVIVNAEPLLPYTVDLFCMLGYGKSSANRIAQYEMGYRSPKANRLKEIAKAMNIREEIFLMPDETPIDLLRILIWYDWEHEGVLQLATSRTANTPPGKTVSPIIYSEQLPLNRLLLDWADKKHSLSVRKITRADYLEWMLQWPPRLP